MNSATPAPTLEKDLISEAMAPQGTELTANDVAQFLAKNPSFFIKNPTLLNHMKLPTESGEGVTDFFAFQANQLKKKLFLKVILSLKKF